MGEKRPLFVRYVPSGDMATVHGEAILVSMTVDDAHNIAHQLADIPCEPRGPLRRLISELLRVASENA